MQSTLIKYSDQVGTVLHKKTSQMAYETRGRPKKASGEKLSKQITIKISPSGKKLFEMEADRCGVDVSELIRGVAINVLERMNCGDGGSEEEIGISHNYSEPIPEDFRELMSFLEEMKERARSAKYLDELEDVLRDFRVGLREWVEEYRERIRRRKEVINEIDDETAGNLGTGKKTDQITFRVRPKDYEWLEEIHSKMDPYVGISPWIRSGVRVWINEEKCANRVRYYMPSWDKRIDSIYETLDPPEIREGIVDLADDVETYFMEKKKGSIPGFL